MTDRTDDRQALAAEYALGLLDAEDLRLARRLEATDPDFAAEAARWRGRLAPLFDEVAPADPPAELWQGIARLTAADRSNVVVLRRRVGLWRAATAGMTALAASLAAVLLLQPDPARLPAPAPVPAGAPMVAMLGDSAKDVKIMASWDPAGRRLVLAVAGDMPADPGHSHELWVIPPGGEPRSLGTMPDKRGMQMGLEQALAELLRQGAQIAITVEPPAGSPTGKPTGPIIAAGTLEPV